MPSAAFLGNRAMNSSTPVALSAASGRGLPGDFWPKIERFLEIGMLVPVLGPGVITFGENDQLLYPWVTAQVASRLGLDPEPPAMHELVCTHLRKGGSVEEVCFEIDVLLASPAIEPGPLLKTLASVAQCRLFLTLGFDPLMERALNLLRGAGSQITKTWCFSLDRESVDLPNLEGSRPLLAYLFGKASPNPGYLLWDADAIEFVWQLQRQLPALNTLGRTLSENNLLILGTKLPDWLVRFLLSCDPSASLQGGIREKHPARGMRTGRPPIIPEDVATRIVRAAAGAEQDVPIEEIDAVPPILSLLCERLNERRMAASRTSITAADFSADEAKRILGEFYDDKLRPHPTALRHYLEDKLVSDSGFRENVSLDSVLTSLRESVPDAAERLDQLVNDRVLFIEARGGSVRGVEFPKGKGAGARPRPFHGHSDR